MRFSVLIYEVYCFDLRDFKNSSRNPNYEYFLFGFNLPYTLQSYTWKFELETVVEGIDFRVFVLAVDELDLVFDDEGQLIGGFLYPALLGHHPLAEVTQAELSYLHRVQVSAFLPLRAHRYAFLR
jgi:hypothetical protein